MTRPIDTIRHQAKTVTVGISRPQEILPPVLLAALESLSAHAAQIREQDRRMLRLASPIIRSVAGGLLYKAHYRIGDGTFLQTSKRSGVCEGKASRYDEPRQVGGSKRTALRLERAIWSSGPAAEENLLIVPLFDDESGRCEGLVLLHLEFQDTASLQQKLSLLRAMGARYDELIERLEEISGDAAPESRLELISPRDLLLAPVDTLAAQLRSSEPQASGRGGPGGSRAL
jgi:glucosamine--fructose-6-phosphate aminotransferase (isomerizing)